MSPYLKYLLYENEDTVRLMRRIKENGSFDNRIWFDIPKEIASDVGRLLLKVKNK